MASDQAPGGGMDFWAALGVGKDAEEQADPRDEPVQPAQDAGTAAAAKPGAADPKAARPGAQDEWNSLFSAWPAAGVNGTGVNGTGEAGAAAQVWPQPAAPQPVAPQSAAPQPVAPQPAALAKEQRVKEPEKPRAPRSRPEAKAAPRPPSKAKGRIAADPDWQAAERLARSLQPRLPDLWLKMLTRHTDGDEAMASRVYNVLSGAHLLGELWRDEQVEEVHIHGTEVTVCGARGVYQVPGFPSLATARRAIEAAKTWRGRSGAVVSRIGNSVVVVSRRPGAGPDAATLVAGEIMTREQLAEVARAVEQMQAVTVTGPAARIIVRSLASLVPAGSRVYLAAYATLPAGCVAAAHPMEADYVIGVRPGETAEEMAATGQLGAIIANPEKQIPAAVRFTVSGQSASPGKLSRLT